MTDDERPTGEQGNPGLAAAFLVGLLTAGVIAVASFVFLGLRLGFSTIWERTGIAFTGVVLDMPDELIDELTAVGGVIGNAGNPTKARKHDTILVQPDEERGYVLRPGASVDGYHLRAADAVNLDPPVVYVRSDSQLSDALRAYLDEHARVEYTYDIGDDGFRVTVPAVKAGRKILMAGDSGVFGVGVDDEDTIASRLQGIVGGAAQVVNAGVGGYDGDQAFLAARDASDAVAYDQLVYVAHHNDFYEPRDIANPDRARQVLARFESIRDRFPGGVVVALLTYLEFNAEDVLGSQGWTPDRLEAARRLRGELPIIARKAGFGFVDFSDVVDAVRARERTIFAPWSLYVDHAHLSPRAAGLFAAEIEAALAGEAENASARQRR